MPTMPSPSDRPAIAHGSMCPACGHHVAVTFYPGGALPLATLAWPKSAREAQAMKRLPHDFVRCADCGHVYNRSFDYTEVPYSEKPNLMFNKGQVWSEHLKNIRDLILSRLPERATVVEIGCGEGHLLRALAEANPRGRYIGFDPNAAVDTGAGQITACNELFDPAVHLAELKPDWIVSRHVMEHLSNPLGFIQSLAFAASWERLATRLLIEVPCIDNVLVSGRTVDFFYEHNSHFTTTSLRRMLMRCCGEVELIERGYNDEVVYGVAHIVPRTETRALAQEALAFAARATTARQSIIVDVNRLAASGLRVALWGGTGKAAAFINQYELDAARFPLVVDSDLDKVGTYVPGMGQVIASPEVLLSEPAEVILITTQWRARDIVLEIERRGIRYQQILLEHAGNLVDYHHHWHPYGEPDADLNPPHFQRTGAASTSQ